ncbi:MAG: helix-hairpin-helix domain-containing protein [Thermodesulfobacteriota bacterium]
MGRRVDINTASREELKLLPGIGEVLAERIVERRALLRKDGKGFYSLLELKEINGIGEKKFEAIYSYVKVDTNLGKGR